MKKYLSISALIFMLAASFFNNLAYADIAVIIHPSNKSKINVGDVKQIFLKQRKVFPGGKKVYPVNQQDTSVAKKLFAKKVLKKSTRELKTFWSRLMFSGQDSPPPVKKGDTKVKEFVASSPGGIGYINVKNVDKTVKVVFTIK